MNTNNAAREEVLLRIRQSLRDVSSDAQAQYPEVFRNYRQSDSTDRETIIQYFIERVTDYKVNVQRIHEKELQAIIAVTCSRKGIRQLVIPADIPAAWLPDDVELLRDDMTLSYDQIDNSDGVITGCYLGIAQTGTIILAQGAYQGRRVLTLLPDYHLCVIYEDQIVNLVPEAITHLSNDTVLQRNPITCISGPSATSDIELSRVEGVHGPRTLEVLVVRRI